MWLGNGLDGYLGVVAHVQTNKPKKRVKDKNMRGVWGYRGLHKKNRTRKKILRIRMLCESDVVVGSSHTSLQGDGRFLLSLTFPIT